MTAITLIFVWLYAAAPLLAQASVSPPSVYSLDGVVLGSNIRDLMAKRGKLTIIPSGVYVWTNLEGGTLSVTTDADGRITLIDVQAGKTETRSIDISGSTVRFNDGGHINNPPPPWANFSGDDCKPDLKGQPCFAVFLPRGDELVMNFGGDTGTADWDLTELILGSREALLRSGTVVNHPY